VDVTEFADMSAPMLRLTEARYLFEQFKSARSADPNYGLFLLTVYFDSFLFGFISIEEMVDASTRDKLRKIGSFLFFKALRNISTHHIVLSSIKGKFERPICRIVSEGVGCDVEFSEQFFISPDKLRAIFHTVLRERPGERQTIEAAMKFLLLHEARGGKLMVVDLVQTAIADIESYVA